MISAKLPDPSGGKIEGDALKLKIIIVSFFCLFFFCTQIHADAPEETYHVAFKDISPDVLKDTIGILTISNTSTLAGTFKSYDFENGHFIIANQIEINKNTIPISNFGYVNSINKSEISAYRYPITKINGDYICVVYEPKKNLKTWLNLKQLKQDFRFSILMLDDFNKKDPDFYFYIDVFYFTQSKQRKVYKLPVADSEFSVISGKKYSLLTVIEQKDMFLKVGIVNFNPDTLGISIEPIGWIKIKDNNGMLTIWIFDVDLC